MLFCKCALRREIFDCFEKQIACCNIFCFLIVSKKNCLLRSQSIILKNFQLFSQDFDIFFNFFDFVVSSWFSKQIHFLKTNRATKKNRQNNILIRREKYIFHQFILQRKHLFAKKIYFKIFDETRIDIFNIKHIVIEKHVKYLNQFYFSLLLQICNIFFD